VETERTSLVYEDREKLFGQGPWLEEPDRVEWRLTGGLVGLLRRNQFGVWCGYVGVPPGHPWHGKSYDEVEADVHGGLTYSKHCNAHICHVPEPGEPEHLFWLGFDCGHAGDESPGIRQTLCQVGGASEGLLCGSDVYRDLEYARAEVQRLAEQALDCCS